MLNLLKAALTSQELSSRKSAEYGFRLGYFSNLQVVRGGGGDTEGAAENVYASREGKYPNTSLLLTLKLRFLSCLRRRCTLTFQVTILVLIS